LALARSLSEHEGLVHAAIDLSDGLSSDLPELCRESGLFCLVDPEKIPIDSHVTALERARGGDALDRALHGGEDYELLLAVAPDDLEGVGDLAVVWDVPLSVIGEFGEGAPTVSLRRGERLSPLAPGGHDAFQPSRSARPRRS
jgi:thiamine-monophosphate kinase